MSTPAAKRRRRRVRRTRFDTAGRRCCPDRSQVAGAIGRRSERRRGATPMRPRAAGRRARREGRAADPRRRSDPTDCFPSDGGRDFRPRDGGRLKAGRPGPTSASVPFGPDGQVRARQAARHRGLHPDRLAVGKGEDWGSGALDHSAARRRKRKSSYFVTQPTMPRAPRRRRGAPGWLAAIALDEWPMAHRLPVS